MYQPSAKALFEFMACWCGGATAGELGKLMGMRREAAQTRIADYKREYGAAGLSVVGKAKRTIFAGSSEGLKCTPSTVTEVVTILSASNAFLLAAGEKKRSWNVPVEDTLLSVDSGASAEEFRAFCGAIARREALQIDYIAKNGLRSFRFSPHTIVRSGFRIHVRGAETRDQSPTRYIDLIPARATRIENLGEGPYLSAEFDDDWHKTVTLKARIRKWLDGDLRESVEREYRLEPGRDLVLPVRSALSHYIADELVARRTRGSDKPLWFVRIDDIPHGGEDD